MKTDLGIRIFRHFKKYQVLFQRQRVGIESITVVCGHESNGVTFGSQKNILAF